MVSLNGKAEAKTDDKVVERPIPATAPVGTSGTKSDGEKSDWKDKFSEVERDLTAIIGGGPSTGAPVAGRDAGRRRQGSAAGRDEATERLSHPARALLRGEHGTVDVHRASVP